MRKADIGALHFAACALGEVPADHVADAARARMQHDPDALAFIQTDFDEVIAAAQCAELADPGLGEVLLHRGDAGGAGDDALKSRRKGARALLAFPPATPGSRVLIEAHRHRRLDRAAKP